jgi:poly(3-hydroxyoctanoate) depolymerase
MLKPTAPPTARPARLAPLTSLIAVSVLASTPALADRCTANAQGFWTCSYQEIQHSFSSNANETCTGKTKSRVVRWQVPEGTPPAGGWPVVFYYNGTVFFNSPATKPFTSTSTAAGANFAQTSLHELLDDPSGSGRKYAVIAPEAQGSAVIQAWDTNSSAAYSTRDDFCFLPELFKGVSQGKYGDPSLFDMSRRYALGISSGGYNTSRMAVTFNQDSAWKALVIVSGSYATCLGPFCNVPKVLPANHPPTKFYHGTADLIVPIATMRPYHDLLKAQGVNTQKLEHKKGHQFTQDLLGSGGAKAWFDQF